MNTPDFATDHPDTQGDYAALELDMFWDDLEWFATHPSADHRLREYVPGEFGLESTERMAQIVALVRSRTPAKYAIRVILLVVDWPEKPGFTHLAHALPIPREWLA